MALTVHGTVFDGSNVEVFGATVSVTVFEYDGDCAAQAVGPAQETTVNEEGAYSLSVRFDRDEFEACVRIDVSPPDGSDLQPQFTIRFGVEFNDLGSGIESERADFVLLS